MGEQHAKGDFGTARIERSAEIDQKFRDDTDHGSFKIEESALVEDRGDGCSRDGLGEGGEVEESEYIDIQSIEVKIPTLFSHRTRKEGWGTLGWSTVGGFRRGEGFQGDQAIAVGNGDRGDGEAVLRDRVAQNGECYGKRFILMFEGLKQWGCGGQSLCAFGKKS